MAINVESSNSCSNADYDSHDQGHDDGFGAGGDDGFGAGDHDGFGAGDDDGFRAGHDDGFDAGHGSASEQWVPPNHCCNDREASQATGYVIDPSVHPLMMEPCFLGCETSVGQFVLMLLQSMLTSKWSKASVRYVLALFNEIIPKHLQSRIPKTSRIFWLRVDSLVEFYSVSHTVHVVCDSCGFVCKDKRSQSDDSGSDSDMDHHNHTPANSQTCQCSKPVKKKVAIWDLFTSFTRRRSSTPFRDAHDSSLATPIEELPSSDGLISSFWDSEGGRRLMEDPEGCYLPLNLCVDGISPQKYSSFSCTPAFAQNIRISPEMCGSPINFAILGIVEGSAGIGTNIFLQNEVVNQIERNPKISLAMCTFDSPAMAKAIGTGGATSYNGCYVCNIRGEYSNKRMKFPLRRKYPPPSLNEVPDNTVKVYSEKELMKNMVEAEQKRLSFIEGKISETDFESFVKTKGFKLLPPLHRIEHFSIHEQINDDVFHTVCENLLPAMHSTTLHLLSYVFGKKKFKVVIHQFIQSLKGPSRISEGIRPWTEGRRWKGSDSLTTGLYIALPVIKRLLADPIAQKLNESKQGLLNMLAKFWALSTVMLRLLMCQSISESWMGDLNFLVEEVVFWLQFLGQNTQRLCFHRLTHMPDKVKHLGPLASPTTWMMSKERFLSGPAGWITGPNGQFVQAVRCIDYCELIYQLSDHLPQKWRSEVLYEPDSATNGQGTESSAGDEVEQRTGFDQETHSDETQEDDAEVDFEEDTAVLMRGKGKKRVLTKEEFSSLIQFWMNRHEGYKAMVNERFRTIVRRKKPAVQQYYDVLSTAGFETFPSREVTVYHRCSLADVQIRTASAINREVKTNDATIAILYDKKIHIAEVEEIWATELPYCGRNATVVRAKIHETPARRDEHGMFQTNNTKFLDATGDGHLLAVSCVYANVLLLPQQKKRVQVGYTHWAVLCTRWHDGTQVEVDQTRIDLVNSTLVASMHEMRLGLFRGVKHVDEIFNPTNNQPETVNEGPNQQRSIL